MPSMVQSYHNIPSPSHTPYTCSLAERTVNDVKTLCQPGQSIPALFTMTGETGETGETRERRLIDELFYDAMDGMGEREYAMAGDTPWFEDYENELKMVLEMEEEMKKNENGVENGMEIEWKPYEDEVGKEKEKEKGLEVMFVGI